MEKILVTGACGQIGTALTRALRVRFGADNVIATSRRARPSERPEDRGPFELLDVTDSTAVDRAIVQNRIGRVFHLAAMLSAVGERDPQRAWRVNIDGLHNVLESVRKHGVGRVFWPSSIAVFGPSTPKSRTPQDTVMRPTTMYGVTKVTGELLCDYYVQHYAVDIRGVRYPGVISAEALPGGGTTDYAVEMFYEALRTRRYRCFVREDTVLPMIYMPDCIKAALDLMDADLSQLEHHNAFNLASMSFSAGELATEITKHISDFVCEYSPDYRQAIAQSWPMTVDDTSARNEWHWKPQFDLATMTADMLERLGERGRCC